MTLTLSRPRVKILFSAYEPHPAPATFAEGLEPELTATEMRRIDGVRRSAFADAAQFLPEAEAERIAGDAAEHEAALVRARRLLDRLEAKYGPLPSQRGRKPYTGADLAWWAEHSPANRRGYQVVGPSDAALELAAGEAGYLASVGA